MYNFIELEYIAVYKIKCHFKHRMDVLWMSRKVIIGTFRLGAGVDLRTQLKSSQLAVFYPDAHSFAGTTDFHFVDVKSSCDIPCAFARKSPLD